MHFEKDFRDFRNNLTMLSSSSITYELRCSLTQFVGLTSMEQRGQACRNMQTNITPDIITLETIRGAFIFYKAHFFLNCRLFQPGP